jgi:hypothetical protein
LTLCFRAHPGFFPSFFAAAWAVAIGSPQWVSSYDGKFFCAEEDPDGADETAVLEVLRASDETGGSLRRPAGEYCDCDFDFLDRAAWAVTAAVVKSTTGPELALAKEAVVRTLIRLRCPDDDVEPREMSVVLLTAVVLVRALVTLLISSLSPPSPSVSSSSSASSSPATDMEQRTSSSSSSFS